MLRKSSSLFFCSSILGSIEKRFLIFHFGVEELSQNSSIGSYLSPDQRAILLSGARQVGKTTLILQAIQELLDSGVPPGNILYATFDHPIYKLAGLDAVLEAWREVEPKNNHLEYLFLDEAQFVRHIGTWIKHRVDFAKTQRIIFTRSATPLLQADQESGVGRWHTIEILSTHFL